MSKTTIRFSIIICLALIMVVLSVCCFKQHHEPFVSFNEQPQLVYRVDTPMDTLYIFNPYEKYLDLKKYWYKLSCIDTTSYVDKAHVIIKDVGELDAKKDVVVCALPHEFCVLILFKRIGGAATNINDIMQLRRLQGKSVKVGMWSDLTIAKDFSGFMWSINDIDSKNINTIQIQEPSDEDLVVAYGTLPDIKRKLSSSSVQLDFVRLDTIDIHMLKVAWEYARFESIDTNTSLIKQPDPFSIRKLIAFDLLLVQNKPWPVGCENDMKTLLENFGSETYAKTNYYTRFFNILPWTQDILRSRNKHIQNKSTGSRLQILEEFADKPDHLFEMEREVPGFYHSASGKFYATDIEILYIPLKVGTKLKLTKQSMAVQNGVYTVESVDDNSAIFKKEATKQHKSDVKFDGRYKCYGDPYIANQGLCNSPLDEIGSIKRERTYWDRPCEVNEECPFYQKNTTYPNYRGGCNDGYCEMPVGVKRLSWRLYDKSTMPVCHGCPPSNLKCCDEKNKNYVFELDSHERSAAKQQSP